MTTLVLCAARGVPLLGPSGCSVHLRGVVEALRRRGPVTAAVASMVDQRGCFGEVPAGVRVVERPVVRWGPGWLQERQEVWNSRALVKAAGPFDAIYERHSLFSDGGVRSGVRRIVELNAPLVWETGGIRDVALARRLEWESLVRADRVVAVSAWLARWAVELGCDPDRVRHVPNGCGEPLGDGSKLREKLGAELVLGFVGSCKPWHGLSLLPQILERMPEAVAVVVGHGPAPPPAHGRIHHIPTLGAGLEDAVAAFDVGLMPYFADAPPWFCPLKLWSYRAQGVPVVSSPVGEIEGDDVVVTERSADAWVEAIGRAKCLPRTVRTRTWETVVEESLRDF